MNEARSFKKKLLYVLIHKSQTHVLDAFIKDTIRNSSVYFIEKQNDIEAYKIHVYCNDGNVHNLLVKSNGETHLSSLKNDEIHFVRKAEIFFV